MGADCGIATVIRNNAGTPLRGPAERSTVPERTAGVQFASSAAAGSSSGACATAALDALAVRPGVDAVTGAWAQSDGKGGR